MLHIIQNKFTFPASWGRAFLVTLFFVTLSSGLFWLDFFRSYSAEVTVLIVPRSGVFQSGVDAAENLTAITRTLSFYDRVLASNDFIDDVFVGYAPDKRKELWNNTVSVKRTDGGSVLIIRAIGNTSEMAGLYARETAQTLFSTASFYYNVKTDIDMRIIDGPLVSYVLVKPLLFGSVSLLTGFFVTAFFFLILNMAPKLFVKRKEAVSLDEILVQRGVSPEKYVAPEKAYPEFTLGETVPWIDPRKFIPAKPTTLSFENVMQETKRSTPSVMHAPAPANLPVASSEMDFPEADEAPLPFEFEAPADETEALFSTKQGEPLGFPVRGEHSIVTNAEVPAQERGEPTAEEYKRRLNRLLSGSN